MSQYYANQATRRCDSYVPKSEDCFVTIGNERSRWKHEPFYFILHMIAKELVQK